MSKYSYCISRACYILQVGDLELSANFLINIGFNDSNEDYNPETRYRALLVLQSIVDTAKLEDLTKRDYQTIRYYILIDHLFFFKFYIKSLYNYISGTT